MARSQVDETAPEVRQQKKESNLASKIPKNYKVHFSFTDEGKVYLACYNSKEKDVTKAWVRVEA